MGARASGTAAAAVLALAAPVQADVGQPRTGGERYDRNPSVVAHAGTTYLFFARSQQDCDRLTTRSPGLCPDSLDYDLYFKTSADGGRTFGPAEQLDADPDGPGPFRGRTVAATPTADGVHVFWSNGANSIDGRVWHYFKPAGGPFTPREEMADVPDDVFNAEAVADSGHVFLYTEECCAGASSDIYARRYAATGPALAPDADNPQLAAEDKSLPRAIRDVEGGFRMTMVDASGYPTVDVHVDSSADGLHWPAPEPAVVSVPGVSHWDPSLAQKPNGQYHLYLAPDREAGLGSQRIALSKSNDFARWSPPHELTPGRKGGAEYWDYWPEGFLRGNQLVLFYTSERGFADRGSGTGHIWSNPGFGGLDGHGPGA